MGENKKAKRAKLFMPFDALKGFREALKEKEKIKVNKIELSPDAEEELANTIMQLKKGIMVEVTYFEKNEYLVLEGLITNIDEIYHTITIVKKTISINDILRINIKDKIATFYND